MRTNRLPFWPVSEDAKESISGGKIVTLHRNQDLHETSTTELSLSIRCELNTRATDVKIDSIALYNGDTPDQIMNYLASRGQFEVYTSYSFHEVVCDIVHFFEGKIISVWKGVNDGYIRLEAVADSGKLPSTMGGMTSVPGQRGILLIESTVS